MEEAKSPKLGAKHSAFVKILIFILALVLLAAAVGGVFAAAGAVNWKLYNNELSECRGELLYSQGYNSVWNIFEMYIAGDTKYLDTYCGDLSTTSNVKGIVIEPHYPEGETLSWGEAAGLEYGYRMGYSEDERAFLHDYQGYDPGAAYVEPFESSYYDKAVTVTFFIDPEFAVFDDYLFWDLVMQVCYALRWWCYAIAAAGLAGFVLCFVFLMQAAGRRRGVPGAKPTWATHIPFDALTALYFLIGLCVWWMAIERLWSSNDIWSALCVCAAAAVTAALVLSWCMSLAVRIKVHKLWNGSLCWFVLRPVIRLVKKLWAFVKETWVKLRIEWRAGAVFFAWVIVEFIAIAVTAYEPGAEILLFALSRLVLLAATVWLVYMLRSLRRCGREIAAGNLGYRADTKYMPTDFREHARDLESISGTVNRAVEQRMRGERMKTELITNVSHDLKTPLTSIINYADLICREESENPRISEYAGVLHRQSERMKRLVDDLVEASKASTGNLDINLAPCEAGVMLMQAVGEYQQRMEAQGLLLVAGQTIHPVMILADGRRLWRVMDNILGNICKYAMPGTRVYISLEDRIDEAAMVFKNTSREPLDLSPDELTERFVRGDSSRSSEGSGLGLSIAKSLTELQGGRLDIVCDGDLFKVSIVFPKIK